MSGHIDWGQCAWSFLVRIGARALATAKHAHGSTVAVRRWGPDSGWPWQCRAEQRRFSMSPRAQLQFFVQRLCPHCSGLSDVTTKRGFSLPSICSALAITRRSSQPRFFVLRSLISELGDHSRRLAGLVPLLGRFPHLPSDDPSQSLIERQPKHVICALVFAPTHRFVAAESEVSPQDDFYRRPCLSYLINDSFDLGQASCRSIAVGRSKQCA